MNWLLRRREPGPAPRPPHARPMTIEGPVDDADIEGPVDDADIEDLLAAAVFTCTTCGRTDLPETGDWDPPICEECDAAINFDTLLEEMDQET